MLWRNGRPVAGCSFYPALIRLVRLTCKFWRPPIHNGRRWSDAIDVGYAGFVRVPARSERSREFHSVVGRVERSDDLPVICGDSRLSLGCESFGREARYTRARSDIEGNPSRSKPPRYCTDEVPWPYLQPSVGASLLRAICRPEE